MAENPFAGLDMRRRKDACDFGAMREELDDEMRGYLDDALSNKAISDGKITQAVKAIHPRPFAVTTISRHRKRECCCFPNGNS